MNQLQRFAGISAILEAVIYVSAFIYFGVFWHYPGSDTELKQLAYLVENKVSISIVYFAMYVLFGILLAILNCGIYNRFKNTNSSLIQLATIFGIIWVGLVIATGMLSNIGLSAVIDLSVQSPDRAFIIWSTVGIIVEGLGGGNEVVGGLWVLLLSLAAIQAKELSTGINYLGVFVGTVGILTVYPAEVLTEIFGLSQIVWFVWLGVILLAKDES